MALFKVVLCRIMFLLSPFVILPFLSGVRGAIGPSSDLHIVNKEISPDGFSRSYVEISFRLQYMLTSQLRATLAGSRSNNAIFPGPVITGFKVS